MKSKMKKTGVLLLIACVALLLVFVAGCAGPAATPTTAPAATAPPASSVASTPTASQPAGPKIELTMAGTVPDTDIKSRAVRRFVEEVSKETGGAIQINFFPAGQLIKDKDMVSAIPQGLADLAQCQLGSFSGLIAETQLFDLRMVFQNDEHWFAVANGKVGEIVDQKLQSKTNCKLLSWMPMGSADCWASTTKTIKLPEDMKGLKFRTPPSALLVKAVTALGANGTIVSEGELYTALQTNVVSATFCTIGIFNSNKWYEVAPYVSRMDIAPNASHAIIVNMDSWKKIPAQYQPIIAKAAKNAEDWARNSAKANNEDFWAKTAQLQKEGKLKDLYVIPDDIKAKWAEIVVPSQKAAILAVADMTPGVLDIIEQARPK